MLDRLLIGFMVVIVLVGLIYGYDWWWEALQRRRHSRDLDILARDRGMERRPGETDAMFRRRIVGQALRYSPATHNLIQAALDLPGVQAARVMDGEPGTAVLHVVLDERRGPRMLTPAELAPLEDVLAAGVSLEVHQVDAWTFEREGWPDAR